MPGVIPSADAISLFPIPCAISRSTSCSRRESLARGEFLSCGLAGEPAEALALATEEEQITQDRWLNGAAA